MRRHRASRSTRAASFVSTSFLYSRPDGSRVSTSIAASTAGKSGDVPADRVIREPTTWTSPLRRSVTVRSPSCTGSTVYVATSLRVGFGIAPNSFSIDASAAASSNLPDDDQHRVVGLVVLLVERAQRRHRDALDVGARADRVACRSCARGTRSTRCARRGCAVGLFSPISNSLRTTENSVLRSSGEIDALTMRSASSVERPVEVLLRRRQRLEVVRAIEPRRAVGLAAASRRASLSTLRWRGEPLNIMCSSRCAMPVSPYPS